MKFSELKECPFCGSNKYLVREHYYGSFDFTYRFDNKDVENDSSEMYDGLSVKTNARAYCKECGNYLGNTCSDTISKKAENALKGV